MFYKCFVTELVHQCTKCNKMFTPGITKNAHWCVSHNNVWKTTPKTLYFREIPPILPETPFEMDHVKGDPVKQIAKICEACDQSDFYSKDEYKIHQCVVHGIPPKRTTTKSPNDRNVQETETQKEIDKVSTPSIENPWKCNIETCPKRNIETMTVDQFLDHWGIHKRMRNINMGILLRI